MKTLQKVPMVSDGEGGWLPDREAYERAYGLCEECGGPPDAVGHTQSGEWFACTPCHFRWRHDPDMTAFQPIQTGDPEENARILAGYRDREDLPAGAYLRHLEEEFEQHHCPKCLAGGIRIGTAVTDRPIFDQFGHRQDDVDRAWCVCDGCRSRWTDPARPVYVYDGTEDVGIDISWYAEVAGWDDLRLWAPKARKVAAVRALDAYWAQVEARGRCLWCDAATPDPARFDPLRGRFGCDACCPSGAGGDRPAAAGNSPIGDTPPGREDGAR